MAPSHVLASVFLSICYADLLAESEYVRDGAADYRIFYFCLLSAAMLFSCHCTG